MGKYIDVKDIPYFETTGKNGIKDYYTYKSVIENLPSVDIIRCKDCKNSVCIGERYFCDIQYDEWGQPYVVKPNGFCDVGERR